MTKSKKNYKNFKTNSKKLERFANHANSDEWWLLSNKIHKASNYSAQKKHVELTEKYGNPDRIELVLNKNQKKKLNVDLNISTYSNRPELYRATWLNIEGCDEIVVYDDIFDKYHPYKAILFVIAKKLIHIPDHLLGALKFASETINIEQLRTTPELNNKYKKDGTKEMAMVSGSCASILISVITLDFVIKMVKKYMDPKLFYKNNNLVDSKNGITNRMKEFREEYNERVHNYLTSGDLGTFEKIDGKIIKGKKGKPWFNIKESYEYNSDFKGSGNPETEVGEKHSKLGERLF